MKELIEQIKSRSFNKIYLLYGEEDYLKNYYSNQITKAALPDDSAGFNFLKKVSDIDFSEIDNFVFSPPVFCENKVLFVKNSSIFKNCKEFEKEKWLDYFENASKGVIFVFNENEVDKRGTLFKYVSKNGKTVVFDYRKQADLKSWCERVLKSYNMKMSESDLLYFLSVCPSGMNEILNEIIKLVYYKKESGVILKKDIDISVCKTPENKVFEMIDNAVCGKAEKAFEMLSDLKILDEPPERILANIASEYMKIRKTKLLSSKYTRGEIASMTKIPPYYVSGYIEKSKKLSEKQINKMIELCQQTDYYIKNGIMDKYLAIENLIIQSQN